MACKLILQGISRNDFDKVKSYLEIVDKLVRVKGDGLEEKRLEWIFGIASLNFSIKNSGEDETVSQLVEIGAKGMRNVK